MLHRFIINNLNQFATVGAQITISVAYPWAAVSASSEKRAKSLLEKKLNKQSSYIFKKHLNFKINRIIDTGFKSDKEGVLLLDGDI